MISINARKGLAILVTQLFEQWRLSVSDQLELLGLSPSDQPVLERLRDGEALPGSIDMLQRVEALLFINKVLRLLYPIDRKIRCSWIGQNNSAFNNNAPIEIMKKEGIEGLQKVALFLKSRLGL